MQGYTTMGILSEGFELPTDRKQLEAVYRTLAKSADQRLVRLEALQHEQGFKTATQWAYKKAMNDIRIYDGAMAKRFNTAPPRTNQELLAKVTDIQQFLKSASSTKRGIITVYKKKADTVNKRYGTNFTWEQLANFYMSGEFEKLEKFGGSKTVMRAIGIIQRYKKADDIKKAIESAEDKNKIVKDTVADKTAAKILADDSIDINKLF